MAEAPPAGSTTAAAASPEATGPQEATLMLEDDEAPPWKADVVSPDSGPDHELGLLLFEAEECLARGDVEKAIVVASKAVKQRADSLTARALHERARRELLRGRRRERLEARVREAQALCEAGDFAAAERIATSALKLIPNHPVALALFGGLKERRRQQSTEAWAEQELERLSRARARQSLEAAQAQLAAGRERAAMMTVRRGLRIAPDDPELLAMLHDIEQTMKRAKAGGAGHQALHSQVRAALDLLEQGQIEESLKALRAVLRADPDNSRAQAAVQQVRKAWLRRRAVPPVAASQPPMAPEPPAPRATASPPVASLRPPAPTPAPRARVPAGPAAPAAVSPAATAVAPAPEMSWQDVAAAARGVVPAAAHAPSPRAGHVAARAPSSRAGNAIAARAPSPRARRAAMPLGLILGCAAVLVLVVVAVVWRRGTQRAPVPAVVTPPATAATPAPEPAAGPPLRLPEPAGPLAAVEPDLRLAIEAALTAYSRALETADAALLAEARPDLGAAERDRLLDPFRGALNAATDLRVLDVKRRGEQALVPILRTDVIVGGRESSQGPTEETLRFEHRSGRWVLVSPAGR